MVEPGAAVGNRPNNVIGGWTRKTETDGSQLKVICRSHWKYFRVPLVQRGDKSWEVSGKQRGFLQFQSSYRYARISGVEEKDRVR